LLKEYLNENNIKYEKVWLKWLIFLNIMCLTPKSLNLT
jgi:hypothetical protein